MPGNTLYWVSTSSTDPLAANWRNASAGTLSALATGDVAVLAPIAGVTLTAIAAQTMQSITLAALVVEDGFTPNVGGAVTPWQVGFTELIVRQGDTNSSGRINVDSGGVQFRALITGTATSPTDANKPVVRVKGTNASNELYVSGQSDAGVGANTPGESATILKAFIAGDATVLLGDNTGWSQVINNGGTVDVYKCASAGTVTAIGGETNLYGLGGNGTIVAITGTVNVLNRPGSSTLNTVDLVQLRGDAVVDFSGNAGPALGGKVDDGGGTLAYASPSQVTWSTQTSTFDVNTRRTSTYERS